YCADDVIVDQPCAQQGCSEDMLVMSQEPKVVPHVILFSQLRFSESDSKQHQPLENVALHSRPQIQGVGGDSTNTALQATRSWRSLILIAQLEKVLWASEVLAGVILASVLAARLLCSHFVWSMQNTKALARRTAGLF